MNNIEDILSSFKTFDLYTDDKISLMKRIDIKYVLHVNQLEKILQQAIINYKRLKIREYLMPVYETTYYDTNDFFMYTAHHNGRLNRYKIRHRKYINTNTEFLEVKFKNNKKITNKTRMYRSGNKDVLNEEEKDFITNNSPFKAEELHASLNTAFKRITIGNSENKERITIDIGLQFKFIEKEKIPENLIICEVKKEPGKRLTEFEQILRNQRIKPFRISKYCLGNYYLNNNIKHNLYKEKAAYINKITK